MIQHWLYGDLVIIYRAIIQRKQLVVTDNYIELHKT